MSRRHALVAGIDVYPSFGPETQLAGAVRDARTMVEVLIGGHGFAPEDVLRLFDAQATRSALLGALETLRSRAGAGDQVVVFFSGHGSQMTDREGDEGDGLDETLVPFDSGRGDAENRDVTDDEIHHWAARVLEVTPYLTLIFDCCHAATLHRPGWRVRSVPPDLRPVEALPPSPVPARRDAGVGPRPLMLAACRDDEPAWELPPSIAGEYRGGARRRATGQRLLDLAARPDRFGLSMELFRSRGGGIRDAVALGPEAARERFLAEASRAPVRLGPLAGKSGG